jgi:hypothetical protein
MKKQCSACGEYKIANSKNFHKSKTISTDFIHIVKYVRNLKIKKDTKNNSNKIKERVKQRRQDYPEKLKEEGAKILS